MDAEGKRLYTDIPYWKASNRIDMDDLNVVSEGIDYILRHLDSQRLGLPAKMPVWDPKHPKQPGFGPFLLVKDLNCWVAGISAIRGQLGDRMTTWPVHGLPLFVDGAPTNDPDKLNGICDCLQQAFRIVFRLNERLNFTGLGDGWDDDPLSL